MSKIRSLSPELARKTEQLFQENPFRIKMILKRIKEWLSLHPYLKVRMDDQWLITFARCGRYSLERVKEILIDYYTVKTTYSDIFRKNRDPSDLALNKISNIGFFIPYDNKEDPAGPGFMLVRALFDPAKQIFEDIIKEGGMSADVWLYEYDNLSISGCIMIVDLEKYSLIHTTHITITHIKIVLEKIQKGFPARFTAIHCINTPIIFKAAFEIISFFSTEETKKRIFLHNTVEDLYPYISKANLPNEYGGSAGNIEQLKECAIKILQEHRDWLLEDEQYFIDENLRSENVQNQNEENICNIM